LEKKWDEYEKEKLRQNALSWLKEAERDKNLIAEELSKVEFANSFGDSEKWDTGVTKEQILQKIEEEFENFRKDFIEKLEKELSGNNGDEVEQSENNS
jgi:ribosomal protein L9